MTCTGIADPARCAKCDGLVAACVDCGKPAQCGEPWCATHSPDGDWSSALIPREEPTHIDSEDIISDLRAAIGDDA